MRFLTCLCAIVLSQLALAEVRLPRLISDHMVLQQGRPVRIWGHANAGEQVRVSLGEHQREARADAQGQWEVFLPPMVAGGPYVLRVSASNRIEIQDVLVGEVWVASGQSNMEWPLERVNNAEQEIAQANFERVRLFKVVRKTSDVPLDDVEGTWQPCTPASARGFSAVAYFFARHLHQRLGVPVGVIQSAWGGTPAQAWTSMNALKHEPALHYYLRLWDQVLDDYPAEQLRYDRRRQEWERQAQLAREQKQEPPPRPNPPRGPGHPHAPASLFNAMIAPLTPYAIRGVIWYQGESNAGNREDASLYASLFQTMIRDWWEHWGQGPFPFLFVQLANFAKVSADSAWPELRESQTRALELRHTGMAVTIDIGDPDDIHPRNKQDVGLRLALAARAVAYGEPIVYSGPLFRQLTREGNRLRLWFDHVGSGLATRDGSLPKGFLIAGNDRIFHPAQAVIEGDTIVVWSDQVPEPVAVRYAWAPNPDGNLQNREGLPASPFRTDRWRNAILPKLGQ